MRVSIESWARFQGFATVDNSLKILSKFFFTGKNSSTVTKHQNPAPNSEIVDYRKKEFLPKPEAVFKIEKKGNGNRFAFLQRPYVTNFKSLGLLVRSKHSKLRPTKKKFSPKPEAVFKIEKNGNGNRFAFLQRPYMPNFKSLG